MFVCSGSRFKSVLLSVHAELSEKLEVGKFFAYIRSYKIYLVLRSAGTGIFCSEKLFTLWRRKL